HAGGQARDGEQELMLPGLHARGARVLLAEREEHADAVAELGERDVGALGEGGASHNIVPRYRSTPRLRQASGGRGPLQEGCQRLALTTRSCAAERAPGGAAAAGATP